MTLPARDAGAAPCANCRCAQTWLQGGAAADDLACLERLVYARRRVARGASLFCAGEPFHSIYAIRSGSVKLVVTRKDGDEQVSGFYLSGELLGLDGMGRGHYDGTAVALEDTEVCVLPFSRIEQLAHEVPSFQHRFLAVLSREIARDHNVMLLLGTMRAEERLAAFLLSLSTRLGRRGYSPTEFVLRMKRHEIGSYLGLKLETISRLFGQFRLEGLIEVEKRQVRILDPVALRAKLSRHDSLPELLAAHPGN